MFERRLDIVAAISLLAACGGTTVEKSAPPPPGATMRPGAAFDMQAFERFIATRPNAAAFKARYPQILLVEPGMVTTRELRMDNSRFFATFDGEGRITGGRFS